jgi:hypothetical protein
MVIARSPQVISFPMELFVRRLRRQLDIGNYIKHALWEKLRDISHFNPRKAT